MNVCIQPSNHWEVEKIICAFCQAMAQYCHPSLFTNLFCVMSSLNASCTTYCRSFTYVPTHLARYLLVYQAPSLLYIIITYIQYLFVYLDTLFVLPTYFTTDQTKYLPKTCTNNCPQYSFFTFCMYENQNHAKTMELEHVYFLPTYPQPVLSISGITNHQRGNNPTGQRLLVPIFHPGSRDNNLQTNLFSKPEQ